MAEKPGGGRRDFRIPTRKQRFLSAVLYSRPGYRTAPFPRDEKRVNRKIGRASAIASPGDCPAILDVHIRLAGDNLAHRAGSRFEANHF